MELTQPFLASVSPPVKWGLPVRNFRDHGKCGCLSPPTGAWRPGPRGSCDEGVLSPHRRTPPEPFLSRHRAPTGWFGAFSEAHTPSEESPKTPDPALENPRPQRCPLSRHRPSGHETFKEWAWGEVGMGRSGYRAVSSSATPLPVHLPGEGPVMAEGVVPRPAGAITAPRAHSPSRMSRRRTLQGPQDWKKGSQWFLWSQPTPLGLGVSAPPDA